MYRIPSRCTPSRRAAPHCTVSHYIVPRRASPHYRTALYPTALHRIAFPRIPPHQRAATPGEETEQEIKEREEKLDKALDECVEQAEGEDDTKAAEATADFFQKLLGPDTKVAKFCLSNDYCLVLLVGLSDFFCQFYCVFLCVPCVRACVRACVFLYI